MNTDATILKAIISGKYRDHYLVYSRRSTDDPNIQKNSIKYQRAENTRFALRERLPIAALTLDGFCTDGIISERHSAFKEDLALSFDEGRVQYRIERPKFYRLADFLSRQYFRGAIFLCWDRASRNKGDDTILRKLMKAGVDVRFALAQYDKSSAGELHMDIDGMFAEHHSRVTREKVTLTIRNSRARGLCTNKAPVGYLNIGTMDQKPFDPERASIIKELFAMAASGEWSLVELARWATEQNFRMPPMRRRRTENEMLAEEDDDERTEQPICRPPTFTTMQKILTNPFYTGKTIGADGEWVTSASHQALVSEELFEKVQRQLQRKKISAYYVAFLDRPLRGIANCGGCGRSYTPYEQKGITYYSARCKSGCGNPRKNVSFDYIAEKVGELLTNLSFTKEELDEIDARAGTDIALLEAKRLGGMETSDRKKKKIREDLLYLCANRVMLLRAGVYTPESLVSEERRLNVELDGLKESEDTSDIAMRETMEDVKKLSELLKDVTVSYFLAKPRHKEKIIRTIFSELIVGENTLEYKCRKGFVALQSRFHPGYDPTGWISELFLWRQEIAVSISDLNNLMPSTLKLAA